MYCYQFYQFNSLIQFLGWIALRDKLAADFNITLVSRTIGPKLSLEECISELFPPVRVQYPEFELSPEFLTADTVYEIIMSGQHKPVKTKGEKSLFAKSVCNALVKNSDKSVGIPPNSPSSTITASNGSGNDSLLDTSQDEPTDSPALQVSFISNP